MANILNELEGSISVNDNITPISRNDITDVNSSEWSSLTMDELINQHNALINRMHIIQQYSSDPSMLKAMEQGINNINYYITNYKNDKSTSFR